MFAGRLGKRGEELKKDFESGLARRIATKKSRGPFTKWLIASTVPMTVAVLIGAAALSFAWSGEPGRPDFMQNETVFDHMSDEVLADDGSVDAKRVMTLKMKTTDVPGELHEDYTKLIYRLNVSVNGAAVEEVASGIAIGLLDVVLGTDAVGTVSGNYEVYDSSADIIYAASLMDPAVTPFYAGSPVSVSAIVPSVDGFEADAGDWISLTIVIDFEDPFIPGDIVELPWPGLGLEPYIGEF
jgi:hypothetical protein